MIRIAAPLLVVFALGTASAALAADACRPTRDGKDRIAPDRGCPSGYFMRGACCESFSPISRPSTPVKTCPAGTVPSILGACVAPR